MALNIKDPVVLQMVKEIARITGESQAQAVATALRERMARLQQDALAAQLLAIGRRTAARMTLETKRVDHGALFADLNRT